MKCSAHPAVETNLRCGKCGKPICPRCMVQTLVGARCPDCAKLYKLPTYRVSAKYYLRAIGTALGMAIACGVAWGLVGALVPFFYLNLLLAPAAGYAIGEVVSLAVNRKRGRGLATVAGGDKLPGESLFQLGTSFRSVPHYFGPAGVGAGYFCRRYPFALGILPSLFLSLYHG